MTLREMQMTVPGRVAVGRGRQLRPGMYRSRGGHYGVYTVNDCFNFFSTSTFFSRAYCGIPFL